MEASASSLPMKCSPCLFIHHHHHPFHYHQYSRHNPEPLPDASTGMKLEQGHGFQLPPEEEKDVELVFVMTDEWKEFLAKSDAKRRSERKKAKNKGRNTVRLSKGWVLSSLSHDDMDQAVFQSPEAYSPQ